VCGREEVYAGFWYGNFRERYYFGDTGLNGRIILRWICTKWKGGMDWIDVVQDKDRWRALVKAVTNFRVPKNAGNVLIS
jgi:hypothetical protein